MLLEFGAKNFFCFKEGLNISFRLDKNCPERISQGKDFTCVLGLKGANASGKTNALKALGFIGDFCMNSFQSKPDSEIGIRTFYGNNEPSEFYVEFRTHQTNYRYELEVTSKSVIRETIYRTKAKTTKVLERKSLKLTTCSADFSSFKKIKLRDNASIVSTANQYELEEVGDIYNFFSRIVTNVFFWGMETPDEFDYYKMVSRYYDDNPAHFEFAKNILKECDVGIHNIEILTINQGQEDEYKSPIFIHDPSNRQRSFIFHEESSGTKALYLHLAKIKWVLDTGGVLIHDELDVHLHPMILPRLLELFADSSANRTNAQIIFTTHDTTILDWLGKYRCYMVNKENNESFAYRLDEVPSELLRNDRPISPIYNQQKVGGVPNIGKFSV